MKNFLTIIILVSSLLFINNSTTAQVDSLMNYCSTKYMKDYISDGQQYIALLNKDEVAEFRISFYSGNRYRLATCSGIKNNHVKFTVYDTERNEIFSNKNHNSIQYWDFTFTSTTDCIVEAKIDAKEVQSGVVLLLLGFKNN